ncbi:MAG TPA: hypothetical protein VMU08_01035 [Rhizomicrobium sp.]|nr:hypothetical protein [Rhizomicrobium sp.]
MRAARLCHSSCGLNWVRFVFLDEQLSAGGGFGGRSCRACKQPILKGQASTRLAFDQDPNGVKGLTGDYHVACSKPFDSLARALNMLGRFGR